MRILPLILAPFTRYGAIAVLVVEVLLVAACFLGRRAANRSTHWSE